MFDKDQIMKNRQRPHTPVKYLDRLNTMERKLWAESFRYEDIDPEVFQMIRSACQILSNAMMCVNRNDDERKQYLDRK